MIYTEFVIRISLSMLLGFLIGVQEGRIALWKDGERTPWRIFPYPVSVLPEEDRNALQNGIRVDTMEDLNRLLENFLS